MSLKTIKVNTHNQTVTDSHKGIVQMKGERVLSEPDVIAAVCRELASRGYLIEQQLKPHETGDDIIAAKQEPVPHRILIEAKGETSSRQESQRYGRPFNSPQIRVHVAQAFYKAAEVLSRKQAVIQTRAGIAFPDTTRHRAVVQRIQPVLTQLGIVIFWVQENQSVQIVSADQI